MTGRPPPLSVDLGVGFGRFPAAPARENGGYGDSCRRTKPELKVRRLEPLG